MRHTCCKNIEQRQFSKPMNPQDKNLFLMGEVVETYDDHGKCVAKVRVHSQFVETVLEPGSEAHLGDKLIIEASLAIKNVKPCLIIQKEDQSSGNP
jgi:hypothetical protein